MIKAYTKPVRTGHKVKIYGPKDSVLYAEVIGIRKDGKLVVAPRPEFRTLTMNHFDHFRESKDVIFLDAEDKPVKKSSVKKVITIKPMNVVGSCTYRWYPVKRRREVSHE